MNMPEFQGVAVPEWLLGITLIFLITGLAGYLVSKLTRQLGKNAKQGTSIWRDALLKGARRPALAMIWALGLFGIVEMLKQEFISPFFTTTDQLRTIVLSGVFAWALVRIIKRLEASFLAPAGEKKIDPTSVTAIGRLIRISIIVITALMVMQTLGFSVSGVLAFGGVGGLAIGFAAKDMLANFFGALMIYLDKPFKVGDWIRSPDQDIEGTVEYIGWRQTRIRTFSKRPLYVPNATFANISVENPSRMENRRIKETIGLRYEDASQLENILGEIRSYLWNHPEVDSDKIIMANFDRFGASSLDCFIYCFTKTTDWAAFHMVKEEILLHIMSIIHQQGGDIAFPTRTLDVPDALLSSGSLQISEKKVSAPV